MTVSVLMDIHVQDEIDVLERCAHFLNLRVTIQLLLSFCHLEDDIHTGVRSS